MTNDEERAARRVRQKRPPSPKVLLQLPLPPSANHLWRISRGRVHPSAEYARWVEEAGWVLKAQKPQGLPGLVRVKLRAAIPETARDLDNILKPTLDLLERHEIITNDRAVVGLEATWDRTIPAGHVLVEVGPSSDPRRRLTAEGRKRVSSAMHRVYDAAFAQHRRAAAAA
jgi:crossover junction endodeoxyribonuclease RusA